MPFLWGISLKVNAIAHLEFEHVYYDVPVQHVSHDARQTGFSDLGYAAGLGEEKL